MVKDLILISNSADMIFHLKQHGDIIINKIRYELFLKHWTSTFVVFIPVLRY